MCGASSGAQGYKQLRMEGLEDGETVVCSPDGELCHAVQCFSAIDNTGRNFVTYTFYRKSINLIFRNLF
jgi:hypothetical protein